MSNVPLPPSPLSTRDRLLHAAHEIVRQKGYAATSVDDLCRAAEVTKGAFFYHFPTKEALAVASAEAWTHLAETHIFSNASWQAIKDPLERLLGHLEFRLQMIDGPVEAFTCFIGTMVQESYLTSPVIREACDASISAYSTQLATDVQAAIDCYGIRDEISAIDLAHHIQAVLQGAFILAKTKDGPSVARSTVIHLMRYIRTLFLEQDRYNELEHGDLDGMDLVGFICLVYSCGVSSAQAFANESSD